GAGGGRGRVLPGGGLAAVRRPLLPQRVHGRAERAGEGSRGDAQGDPRPGGPRGGPGEGGGGGGEARRVAADQGGGGAAVGGRGDARVHGVPARALDAAADQQRAGAADARDPAADAGGGELPGRPVGPDAGGGAAAVYRRHEVGRAPLPRH